ncbi:MAG: DUF4331 domain-containing protein [Actinomycetes bacterium]
MQPPTPSTNRASRRRRAAATLASGALLAGVGVVGLAPGGAVASSHREAPLISGMPQYDGTDLYAFVSPDAPKKTTIIANWIPYEEPSGGPNFYPFATDAQYDVRIDNDGDAKADQVYRWEFTKNVLNGDTFLYNTGPVTSLDDPDLNVRQRYTLTRKNIGGKSTVLAKGRVAPSHTGTASMPDYAQLRDDAIGEVFNGKGKVYAGQADDPFFLDLRVFDLLYGGDLSEVGNDTLAGYNVNSVAMQVPSKKLVEGEDPVFGVWTTTRKRTASGGWSKMSRLGNPLVNEVVIPLKDKDGFNASNPVDDPQYLSYVTDPELPKLIEAIYGIEAPETPRNDLVSVFLTGVDGLNQPAKLKAPGEMLRLNTSIAPAENPNRLGVIGDDTAGYPNGRRLADDVIDISLQVVEGELVGSPNDLGDAVGQNDKEFGDTFPYIALPHDGSVGGYSAKNSSYSPLDGGSDAANSSTASAGVATENANGISVAAAALGFLAMVAGAVMFRRSASVKS